MPAQGPFGRSWQPWRTMTSFCPGRPRWRTAASRPCRGARGRGAPRPPASPPGASRSLWPGQTASEHPPAQQHWGEVRGRYFRRMKHQQIQPPDQDCGLVQSGSYWQLSSVRTIMDSGSGWRISAVSNRRWSQAHIGDAQQCLNDAFERFVSSCRSILSPSVESAEK